jgi:hypothetical protein
MSAVLELGKPGSAGVEKGILPVVRDGAVVATLRASDWKEAATAQVGDRSWVFAKRRNVLTGRWASEPEEAVRVAARSTSWWKGTWTIELEGTVLDAEKTSTWASTHRYLAGGRQVAVSGTTGRWTTLPTLMAEESLLLDHQVFLLWVELVVGRRNAATTTATGAAVIGGSS